LDALAQINHHAAGLDIGDAEIYAAVPEAAADPAVRVFRTFTTDLEALADWLTACQVDTVAMETTGVYWIPIYELLEARGFQVYLVNARQLKNVSGKKTDILGRPAVIVSVERESTLLSATLTGAAYSGP
jgi:transposase